MVYGLKQISNNVLSSGSWDRTIKFWDINTGSLIRTLTGHTSDIIYSLDMLSDGQTFVSGSEDRTIKLWNVQTGQCLNTIDTGFALYSLASQLNYCILSLWLNFNIFSKPFFFLNLKKAISTPAPTSTPVATSTTTAPPS